MNKWEYIFSGWPLKIGNVSKKGKKVDRPMRNYNMVNYANKSGV